MRPLGPAQIEYLDALRATHGELTPEIILADAERADSPLHDFFEWNDERAAAEQRRLKYGGAKV